MLKQSKTCRVTNHLSFNENEFPGYLRTYCEIIEACKKRNAIFKTLGEYYNNVDQNIESSNSSTSGNNTVIDL